MSERISIEQHSSWGAVWMMGWLFTIGYLDLGLWRGVFGIILWPYYLGAHYAPLAARALETGVS